MPRNALLGLRIRRDVLDEREGVVHLLAICQRHARAVRARRARHRAATCIVERADERAEIDADGAA